MLKVENLSVRYGRNKVLHDISFDIADGMIYTIIGTNGAGKTSLLRAIMGLVKNVEGSIYFGDVELNKIPAHKISSCGIAMCPEGRQLFPKMSVMENLQMGAFGRKGKKGIDEEIEAVYESFPILEQRKNQLAGTLSGGEQEMLAIGRAMVSKPKMMILDEPSWGLAPILVEEVCRIIQRLNEHGVTILLVEQNVKMALKLADYAYVLENGQIVMQGDAKEMLNNPEIQSVYMGV